MSCLNCYINFDMYFFIYIILIYLYIYIVFILFFISYLIFIIFLLYNYIMSNITEFKSKYFYIVFILYNRVLFTMVGLTLIFSRFWILILYIIFFIFQKVKIINFHLLLDQNNVSSQIQFYP